MHTVVTKAHCTHGHNGGCFPIMHGGPGRGRFGVKQESKWGQRDDSKGCFSRAGLRIINFARCISVTTVRTMKAHGSTSCTQLLAELTSSWASLEAGLRVPERRPYRCCTAACFSTDFSVSSFTSLHTSSRASLTKSLTRVNSTWSLGLRSRSKAYQKSFSTSPTMTAADVRPKSQPNTTKVKNGLPVKGAASAMLARCLPKKHCICDEFTTDPQLTCSLWLGL